MDDATRYEIGLPMDEQINVKMTKALKERLNKMYSVKGLAPAEILRRLAYEAVIYFETHDEFSFPATITPEKSLNQEVMSMPQSESVPNAVPPVKTERKLKPPVKTWTPPPDSGVTLEQMTPAHEGQASKARQTAHFGRTVERTIKAFLPGVTTEERDRLFPAPKTKPAKKIKVKSGGRVRQKN
jgi:hypothetical protein